MIVMNWLDRLGRGPDQISLGRGHAEILSWAYSPNLPDNVPHRHTYFEVCLVGEYGSGRFIVEGKEHRLHPGDLFVARPGVIHQILNDGPPLMELYWVSFQWLPETGASSEVGDLMRAFANSPALVVPDEAQRIGSLWRALRAACEGSSRIGQDEQMSGIIPALLLAVAQSVAGSESRRSDDFTEEEPENAVAKMAARYIHDNLERPLAVAEIADHVCVSPRHFCRLFKRFAGVSPAAYITRARLDRARRLLLRTDRSIKEIAVAVGYEDVHYFTRIFARHCHCSPGSYRRGEADVPIVQKDGALV
jgi:AraC family L-rhamnose operon transcriptional activator RhaR